MSQRAKVPTREEHARLWRTLPFADRRRFLRAVGRGEGMPTRKEARIGVGLARQQQAYWKWAWLFGVAMGVVFVFDGQWLQVVITSIVGGLVMGAMARFRYRRAVRAEQENLQRLGGKARS